MKQHTAMLRHEQMQLKSKIASQLRTFHPSMRKTLLANLSEMVAALTQARHVHLAKIAEKVQHAGDEASREQWVRRQLDNQTVPTLDIFKPLAQCLLQGLAGKTIRLILDPTDLDAERCIVMISLAYQQRVLPLAWQSFTNQAGVLSQTVQQLFQTLAAWLPPQTTVYLIADREFRGMDMVALIQQQGWSPIVRCKSDIYVYSSEGVARALAATHPRTRTNLLSAQSTLDRETSRPVSSVNSRTATPAGS